MKKMHPLYLRENTRSVMFRVYRLLPNDPSNSFLNKRFSDIDAHMFSDLCAFHRNYRLLFLNYR